MNLVRITLLRHNALIQLGWQVFATTSVITLLSSVFVFSITPIYRATAYLPKQQLEDLILVSSARFLNNFVEEGVVRFDDYEQFQASEPISSDQIVSILQGNISFSSSEDEYSWVSFESPHAIFVADLVNLVSRHYLNMMSGRDSADLASSEVLAATADSQGAASLQRLSSDLNRIENKIRTTDTLLAIEGVKLKALQMLVDRLKTSSYFDPRSMDDAKLSNMVSTLENLKIEKSTIANRYGSRHSAMLAIETKIASANLDLEQWIIAVRKRQIGELEDAQRQVKGLEAESNALTTERDHVLVKRAALVSETKMTNQPSPSEWVQVEFSEAAVPNTPVYPDKPKMIGTIFVVTFLIVTAIRLLMARMENES